MTTGYNNKSVSTEDKEEKEEQSILNELTTLDRLKNAEELGNDGKKGHDLKLFSFDSIMAATDNFSTENKLGQGGFGPVFKVSFCLLYFSSEVYDLKV